MSETLTFNGRLPGVLCETTAPTQAQNPLRLDIAGFVGLAERGPLDTPVMIEDLSQYQRIFGADLPVARAEGRPIYAHLRSAVDAFFENGGQRCYVVRVAGRGHRTNRFQIPGLLNAGGTQIWQPVTASAAWPGRWSDSMQTGAALRAQPLAVQHGEGAGNGLAELAGGAINEGAFRLNLRVPVVDAVRVDDILRLHLGQPDGDGVLIKSHLLYLRIKQVTLERGLTADLFGAPIVVMPRAEGLTLFAVQPAGPPPDHIDLMTEDGWQELPVDGTTTNWYPVGGSSQAWRLTFDVPVAQTLNMSIKSGDLLRLAGPGPQAVTFVTADRIERSRDPFFPDVVRLTIESRAPLRWQASLPKEIFSLLQVDVLSFDLFVREGEDTQEIWRNLRFSPGRGYWRDALAAEIEMDQPVPDAFQLDHLTNRSLRLGQPTIDVQQSLLPIGMGATPRFTDALPDARDASKDGLDVYDPVALFADAAFLNLGVRTVMREANDLLYLAPQTRRLRGLHSLLPINEIALITIPDLAHAGWTKLDQPVFEEPSPPPPVKETPQGFHDCSPSSAGDPGATDDDCPPPMSLITLAAAGAVIPSGIEAQLPKLPDQLSPAEYDERALLAVQRMLVRVCAARADLVTILNLPQHYTGGLIEQWRDDLANTPDLLDGSPLSYAAAYHPWTGVRETVTPSLAPLRYTPPDGSAAGMIAARTRLRGAWIAPANIALRSVADLAPAFTARAWEPLYNRQINVLRRQPGRFAAMSALTLAADHTLAQLSVRRLLIFLRKLALREGQRYLFETNNARFRVMVQSYFENVMAQLLERGGISAYQVVTGPELNTQNDYDNGRFLIALKVAPTLPIEFITIIMLRSGDDGIDILEI